MKKKELYKRLDLLGAKVCGELTTQTRDGADDIIDDMVDRFFEKYTKPEQRKVENFDREFSDIFAAIYDLGVARGYVTGQLFDFTDPEILQNLEVIKKELVKGGLYPCFPREKKAA